MPAELRSFDAPIEPVVYLDSTYTIAYFDNTDPFHAECDTLGRRIEANSVLAVVSDFVYNELAFHHLKSILAAEGLRQGRSWMWVKQNMPHVFANAIVDVLTRRDELEKITLRLSISDKVQERAFRMMQDFHLLPTDAFHIATAIDSGVTSIVTLDKDFLAVDGIVVYTRVP